MADNWASPPEGALRWGQLTYASFDPDNGAGGWQVTSTAGGLSDGEIEALRQRIVTRFDSDIQLGAFPNAVELQAMPRRLTYINDGQGCGAYWHSTMAGRDSTGRPGNVFSHVLLDRSTAQLTPAIRPIEIWRSPGLLCPFGPEQVREAVLSDDTSPTFGAGLGREDVLDFLFDQSEWRVGLLSALLDAVSAAMNGGPGVVLVTDSAENAALWIAAVSRLAPADWVRRMNFSVYERAAGLDTVFDRGVHLVGVPRADAGALRQQSVFTVLDEHEVPDLGEVGGRQHRTQSGSLITPTHWSALAQAALVDRATFSAATSMMDDVADRVGDTGPEPSWALAMVALRLPDIFGDYDAEAAAVVARHSPDSLGGDEELMQLARNTMQRGNGGSAGETWAELDQDSASRLMRQVLMQAYLQRSLEDDEWLAQTGAIPLPPDYRVEYSTPEARQAARSAILTLQRKFTDDDSPKLPTTAIRTLDFIHRAGLVDAEDRSGESLEDSIAEILERILFDVVDDDDRAKALVSDTGALVDDSLRRKVLAAVENCVRFRTQPAGNRVPPAFCDWLFGALPASGIPNVPSDRNAVVPPMAVEHAIWLCRNGRGQIGGARAVAAAGVMEPGQIEVVADSVLTQIFVTEPPWRASELLFLEQRFPGELLPRFFSKALLKEEWSESLAELIGAVLDRKITAPDCPDSPDLPFARLRLMARQPWAVGHPGEVQVQADWILNTAVHAVTAVQGRLEQVELTALVLEAAVIAVANPRNRLELPREVRNLVAGHVAVQEDGVSDFLHACVDSRVLGQAEIEELTRLAIVTTPGYPGREDVLGDFLSDVMVLAGSERVRLLEVPIRHAVRTGRTDPQSMCDSILTKNWNQTFNTASERLVEKVYEERQKFSREWWKKLRQEAGFTDLDPAKPARFGGFMSAIRKDR
ncbi:hypothetical protein FBY31_3881 [Arthrobacter sp. SLBN-100]|uniref:GAP1-N2 domain-containing protein n=1 Tax=Arthrobacter sp. SLBN-100 TaxID=2768450 RepID=UPI0011515A17|nr:hypothetical protein [Arthrobacter sp. SLBN-100]TQJ69716.1 hypothetical protein FBY31_3881 [Arthrobacter sp. SLBN-100]